MTPSDHVIFDAFVRKLRHVLGGRLRRVVLFGSRARGDAVEGSDFDVLILVDEHGPELRDKILDVEVGMLDHHGTLFAAIVRTEEEWRTMQGFPLAINIQREGVTA